MARAAVLIIAHKDRPSATELNSLKQCYKVLNRYPVILICPSNLDTSVYKKHIPNLLVDYIHPKWQQSYAMFNRLKIDPFLYKRYSQYEFIMFYELDAWVFKDELEYWCNRDFDFIGAPWFEAYDAAEENAKFLGVGNGGFSLRKTKSHLRVLNSFRFIRDPKIIIQELLHNFSFKSFRLAILNLTVRNNTFFLFNDYRFNEDHFWGGVVAKKFSWFRVPDMKTASRFAIELNAPYLYKLNDYKLPFGCHKWEKYQPDFWEAFIKISDVHNPVVEDQQ